MAGHKRCRAVVLLILAVAAWTGLSQAVSAQGSGAPVVSIRPLVLGWDDVGVTRVPPNGPATAPLWSRDGALVACASEATNLTSPGNAPHGANPTPDVYVVDRVTGHNLWVSAPDTSVSPLASAYPLGFSPVPDASGNRVLAFWSNARRLAGEPAGAPDDAGTDSAGRYDLFLARIVPDGVGAPTLVGIERLTNHGAALFASDELAFRGAWSPDGNGIVFTSPDDSDGLELASYADQDLFTLDVATRAITRLTHAIGDATGPLWSPDGTRIAFTFTAEPGTDFIDQNRDSVSDLPPDDNGVADVYLLELSSGAVARVTNDPIGNAAAAAEGAEALAFSPDGARMLFSHVAENLVGNVPAAGVRQLASYDVASGAVTLLTGSPAAQADGATLDAAFVPLGAPARPLTAMVLASRANNLPGLAGINPSAFAQVLLRTDPGTFTLVSRDAAGFGAEHLLEGSRRPSVAPITIGRGLAIAFDSDATNLDGVATSIHRAIYMAIVTPTEGDLRLHATLMSDGSPLNGRRVAAPVNGQLDVSLTVENEGARAMTGVAIDLALPAGVSLTAWDPPSAIVSGGPATFTWSVGDLATGDRPTLQLTLSTPASPGPVTLAAEISSSEPDVDSTPANGAVLEDDLARFTLDIGANGFLTDDAFRGTIDSGDIIPVAALLANDASSVTFTGLVGMSELAGFPGSYTLSVPGAWLIYEPSGDALGQIRFYGTSSFSFQYTANDAIGSPLTATVSVAVNNRMPVAVDQTFGVLPDTPITIQLRDVVFATGNIDPDGDAITLASYGFPDPAAGTLQGFGPVNQNDPTDFGSIVFTPAAGFTGTTSIEYSIVDVADLGGARRDWPYSQARLIFNVDTQRAADLSVEFDYAVYAEVGQTVELQLRVNNAGPAGASGTVRLQRTSNLEFPGAVAGFDPATGLWTLPHVNAGSLAFLRFPVRIIGEGLGSVTAEIVSATAPDPVTVNNRTGINVDGFVREADLSVAVVFSPASVLPGEPITVTAVVSNAGYFAATNVVLTGLDYLLATHVIDSVTPSQGSCAPLAPPQPLQCALDAVDASRSASVTVVARPTMALFPNDVLPEVSVGVRAQVSASERDPSLANNEVYRAFSVRRPRADVSVTLSATPVSVLPGEPVTITATVSNAGPEAATSVSLTDFEYIVATHTIDRVTPSQGTCLPAVPGQWLQCALGTIPSGGSATLVLVVRPTMALFPDEVMPEVSVGVRAEVSAAEQDPVLANNQAYRTFAVRRPRVDLSVNVTATPATVLVGAPVTIAATVTNNGPDAATGANLTGLDYVIGTHTIDSVTPSQGTCGAVAPSAPLQCALGTLASGASITVVVVARPTDDVFGGSTVAQISVGARVQVAADQQDPVPANNQSYRAYDARRPQADLAVTVSASASTIEAGQPITLTAVITNAGASPANNVTFLGFPAMATFPSFAFVTSRGNCAPTTPATPFVVDGLSCDLGTVLPGESVTIVVSSVVPATLFSGTLGNSLPLNLYGWASSPEETEGANNSFSFSLGVTRPLPLLHAALGVGFWTGNAEVGGSLLVSGTVTNFTNQAAANPTARFVFPEALGVIGPLQIPAGWTCSPSPALFPGNAGTPGVTIDCGASSLAAQSPVYFRFEARALRAPEAGVIESRLVVDSPALSQLFGRPVSCTPEPWAGTPACTEVTASTPIAPSGVAYWGHASGAALALSASAGQFRAVQGTPLAARTSAPPPPPGVDFPYGVLSFELINVPVGEAVTVQIYGHAPVAGYWKLQGNTWEPFIASGASNYTAITLVDGGLGDEDGVANGVIVDPGALGVLLDATPPEITIDAPTADAVYVLNQKVVAQYTCVDAESGVGTCTGTTISGAPLDTSSVGTKTLVVSATDAAGNTSRVERRYSVVYAGDGTCGIGPGHQILFPIDAAGGSRFFPGLPVPARFRVCDAGGRSVSTSGVVAGVRLVQSVRDGRVLAADQAVPSVVQPAGFVWDPLLKAWNYLIDTRRLARQATHVFRITLNDGSHIDFQFSLR